MMTHLAYHLEDILFRKLCTEISTNPSIDDHNERKNGNIILKINN